jgi:hypothetical protein
VTLLSTLRLPVPALTTGTTLVEDRFNTDTIGAIPATWSISTGGSAWSVQPTMNGLSGQVLRGIGDTVGDNTIRRIFTRQTANTLVVQWRLRTPSSNAAGLRGGSYSLHDGATTVRALRVIAYNGGWLWDTETDPGAVIGSWLPSTVYQITVHVDFGRAIWKFQANNTVYDNGGAWFPLATGTAGIDRFHLNAYSPAAYGFYVDDVQVASLVLPPPSTTGTVTTTGTYDGTVLGGTKYGEIVFGYDNADQDMTSVRLERSTNGTTWADISTTTAAVKNTNPGRWLVRDRRPHYGAQSVPLGSTVQYRLSAANSAGYGPTTMTSGTALTPDAAAIETARIPKLSTTMAGVPVTSAQETYGAGWVFAMAYAYNRTRTAQYLTDVQTQFDYMVNVLTVPPNIIANETDTVLLRDVHWRSIFYVAAASRLLRAAGAVTLADTLITQCDTWAQAFYTLNSGTPMSTRTINAYDASNQSAQNNQRAWTASTAYAVGAIVRPTTANGRTYRATTGGTSGATQPTWPTTTGGTVTDGTVTWTETSKSGLVSFSTYSMTAPYIGQPGMDQVDPNQLSEEVATAVLLATDSASAAFTAGTYRTNLLNHIAGTSDILSTLATSTGAIGMGEPIDPAAYGIGAYDTLYGSYTSMTLAVTVRYGAALANQWMTDILKRSVAYWNTTYSATEPITGVRYNGSTAIGYAQVRYRQYASLVAGLPYPDAVRILTAAFNDTGRDRIAVYDVNGAATAYAAPQLYFAVEQEGLLALDAEVLNDEFTRTATSSWGAPDQGGTAYTFNTATVANFNVTPGAGTILVPGQGLDRIAAAGGISVTDQDTLTRFSVDVVPTAGSYSIFHQSRRSSLNQTYDVRAQINSTGAITLTPQKVVAGVSTDLVAAATVTGITATAGTFYWMRSQVIGTNPTTVAGKLWADGSPEPTSWLVSTTDSDAVLQSAAGVALYVRIGGSPTTPTSATFTFTNYIVSTTPTPPGSTVAGNITAKTGTAAAGSAVAAVRSVDRSRSGTATAAATVTVARAADRTRIATATTTTRTTGPDVAALARQNTGAAGTTIRAVRGTDRPRAAAATAGPSVAAPDTYTATRVASATTGAGAGGTSAEDRPRAATATTRAVSVAVRATDRPRTAVATTATTFTPIDSLERPRTATATTAATAPGTATRGVGAITYTKTGTATAAAAAVGVDQYTATETGTGTGGTTTTAVRGADHARAGAVATATRSAGPDVYQATEIATAATAATATGQDAATVARQATATTSGAAAAIRGVDRSRIGAAAAATTAAGPDAAALARTGAATTGTRPAATDAYTAARTGAATAATTAVGGRGAAGARVGTVAAAATTTGVDAAQASRAAAATARAATAGQDAATENRQATATAGITTAGQDAYQANETAAATAGTVAQGQDVATYTETATAASATATTGSYAKGAGALTYAKAGTAAATPATVAARATDRPRTATAATAAATTGPDAYQATETATITAGTRTAAPGARDKASTGTAAAAARTDGPKATQRARAATGTTVTTATGQYLKVTYTKAGTAAATATARGADQATLNRAAAIASRTTADVTVTYTRDRRGNVTARATVTGATVIRRPITTPTSGTAVAGATVTGDSFLQRYRVPITGIEAIPGTGTPREATTTITAGVEPVVIVTGGIE